MIGKAAQVVGQPPFWGVAAAALAGAGGADGKRAAIRGAACYAGGAAVMAALRPALRRLSPQSPLPWRQAGQAGFAVGSGQEMRAVLGPLVLLSALSQLPDARAGGRHALGVVVADVVGAGVAVWSNQLWPSHQAVISARGATPRPGVVRHQGV